mmetsp:Transcript_910/g.1842  ORF Transcript_910/g.1842 Transcript_910/m.1842 type:complete len:286 (+) Transcript_910:3132-3989(+)
MTNGGIEGLSSLSRECSSRLINKSSRNKQGDIQSTHFQELSHCVQSSLGIEGVKDGLNHEDITTAINQSNNLLKVALHKLIKSDITSCRIFHRRRDGGSPVGGSQGSHHKSRPCWILGRDLITDLTGQTSTLIVQFIGIGLHLIVTHSNCCGGEGVGTNHIRFAFLEVLLVDSSNDLGLCDAQHVVVALHIAAPLLEPFTSVLFLLQFVPLGVVLDHCSHGTIIDCNLGGKELGDVFTKAVSASNKVGKLGWVCIRRLLVVNECTLFCRERAFVTNSLDLGVSDT